MMRRPRPAPRTLLVTLVAIAGAAPLAAPHAYAWPAGAGGSASVADSIRGVVFDSLLHRPLAGATVLADPGGISTTTDEQGRFTIGGPRPVRRLSAFHQFLPPTGGGDRFRGARARRCGDRNALDRDHLVTALPRRLARARA